MKDLILQKTTPEKSTKNVLFVNHKHSNLKINEESYVFVGNSMLFLCEFDSEVNIEHVQANKIQREFLNKNLGSEISLLPFDSKYIEEIKIAKFKVEVQALVNLEIDAVEFTEYLKREIHKIPLNFNQKLIIPYSGTKLILTVEDILFDEPNAFGVISENTEIFISSTSSRISIKNSNLQSNLLKPNFSFEKLEIGGLKKEFEQMFRRAFVQRLFDPDTIKKMGIPHVKGIMLYGPPGTGKTLIARKLGSLLNALPPKIVNGPEILNKYVGQSEENIRKLFHEAEEDYKSKKENSPLHIIIFDEIDAICKKRGSDSTGVGDQVVNQLLSKIDGVESLNNILVIGMTNRLDLIDEALLRPGRFEIHLEISLPDESSRLEIFQIHTKQMIGNRFMNDDVDLKQLSSFTKNYTGAEISAVVRGAGSFALERKVRSEGDKTVVENDKINITMADMMEALNETKPAFGVFYETDQFIAAINLGNGLLTKLKNTNLYNTSSLLLYGATGTGKTTLAVRIAINSQFPFIKIISPKDLVGMNEYEKVNFIKGRFSDAYKSEESIIILDEIESLIEYVNIGPRFSNIVLQALKIFIKHEGKKKLFVFGTTSIPDVMKECGILDCFTETTQIYPCDKLDYERLSLQNSDFNEIDFTPGLTMKRLLSMLPEADNSTKIGKNIYKILVKSGVEVPVINDPFIDLEYLKYLLKHDSVFYSESQSIEIEGDSVIYQGFKTVLSRERSPKDIPWEKYGIDYVIESSGVFLDTESCGEHKCKKVFLTAPSTDIKITGAAKAVSHVIPELKGKIDGMAFRVPVQNASVVDLVVRVEKETSLQQIAEDIRKQSGVIELTTEEIVSSDIIGNSRSSIFDLNASIQLNPKFFKLICWYDNEHGYSCRVVDLVKYIDTQNNSE
ncbi:unnamed protein product, partial [Medioppia subpectinata]